MMLSRFSLALTLLALASVGTAADGKKPRLDVRASPRIVLSPARVLLTAELVGGVATEDYHCPGVDWDWGDGTHSFHEEDCPPFAPGMDLERRFTATHAYVIPGDYRVKVVLRRANRSVAAAGTNVLVQSGFGTGSADDDEN
jgi:hypothetical protein